MQRANSVTIMDVPHAFLFFLKKIKNQTSKSSKQMYLFLPKFTSEISYLSIALKKNKLASSYKQSRILYYEQQEQHSLGTWQKYSVQGCSVDL